MQLNDAEPDTWDMLFVLYGIEGLASFYHLQLLTLASYLCFLEHLKLARSSRGAMKSFSLSLSLKHTHTLSLSLSLLPCLLVYFLWQAAVTEAVLSPSQAQPYYSHSRAAAHYSDMIRRN